VCRLRLPKRAPCNVAHESTVTRPQSAASANIISNFPEADFSLLIRPTSSKPVPGPRGRRARQIPNYLRVAGYPLTLSLAKRGTVLILLRGTPGQCSQVIHSNV
jgi:hypothetical protein